MLSLRQNINICSINCSSQNGNIKMTDARKIVTESEIAMELLK